MFFRNTLLLAALTLALTFALGCSQPLGLAPGGALSGAVADAPASWDFTAAVNTVQLETLPAAPYSVNIWVIALGANLYVHAGTNRAQWVENMEADARVRMRIGETIYALNAARVAAQKEFNRFSDAYEEKYGRRPRNENVEEAYLFRLTPR